MRNFKCARRHGHMQLSLYFILREINEKAFQKKNKPYQCIRSLAAHRFKRSILITSSRIRITQQPDRIHSTFLMFYLLQKVYNWQKQTDNKHALSLYVMMLIRRARALHRCTLYHRIFICYSYAIISTIVMMQLCTLQPPHAPFTEFNRELWHCFFFSTILRAGANLYEKSYFLIFCFLNFKIMFYYYLCYIILCG